MPLLVIAGILIIYGIFALFSVSIFESFTTTNKIFSDPSNWFYFNKQLINLIWAIGA